MSIIALALLCLSAAAAVVFIAARLAVGGVAALGLKIAASFCALLLAVTGAYTTGSAYGVFIVCGMVCGLLGDVLLDQKLIYPQHDAWYTNGGFIAFGLGHLFYIAAVVSVASIGALQALCGIAVAVIFAAAVFLLKKPLKMTYAPFAPAVTAYSLVLGFTTGLGLGTGISPEAGRGQTLFMAGIVLFFASDIVLSKIYFSENRDTRALTAVNLALYYAGQLAIISSVFYI